MFRNLPPLLRLQVLSWWGPSWRQGTHDTQGVVTDEAVAVVLAEVEAALTRRQDPGSSLLEGGQQQQGPEGNALLEGGQQQQGPEGNAPLEGGQKRQDTGEGVLEGVQQRQGDDGGLSSRRRGPPRVAWHMEPYEGVGGEGVGGEDVGGEGLNCSLQRTSCLPTLWRQSWSRMFPR